MRVHDPLHRFAVREADVVEEAAAQERVRQLLFVVGGDDDDRAVLGLDRLAGFVDEELHPIEFKQQVVGELDIGFVDLVDQDDGRFVGFKSVPQFAAHDVVANVMHAGIAELAVAQAGDGVVFVEALLGFGGGFDVPLDQGPAERVGDFVGEDGLAGAGFALHQQRALQRDRGVDGDLQVAGGDVFVGTLKSGHKRAPFAVVAIVGGMAAASKARG